MDKEFCKEAALFMMTQAYRQEGKGGTMPLNALNEIFALDAD